MTCLILVLAILGACADEAGGDPCPDGGQPVPAAASASIPAGTSAPGCEQTNRCYLPATVYVAVNGTVTWANDDAAVHTATSGTPGVEDGEFDSSLLRSGETFSHTFDTTGTFPYFCQVHPWQTAVVVVEPSSACR